MKLKQIADLILYIINKMNTICKRSFGSLYNYSNAANPKVFLSVAHGDHKIGDLVFELY